MKKIQILVVDDNQGNLTKAETQFKGKNVKLICCNLFSVAAKMLASKKFDILLTDLMIPGEAEGVSSNNPEIGKEVPYGLVLSIIAKNVGVPHVAILTDISHHAGPIAWAMDNVLGTNSFISCFNESNKNWFKAAEGFVTIEDALTDNEEKSATKKTFMLIGINDDYKEALKENLKADFNVIFIPSDSTKNAPTAFVEEKPDFVLLIGEINDDASGAGEYHQKQLFEKLLAMKKPEQKVVAAGFMESQNPDYLRLPFAVSTLLEKMRA
jgi:hypothetical protein